MALIHGVNNLLINIDLDLNLIKDNDKPVRLKITDEFKMLIR